MTGRLANRHKTPGDEIPVTQEFMSSVLGVRRATITENVASLRSAGLIHLFRGKLTILDRTALEAGACACYGIVTSAEASACRAGQVASTEVIGTTIVQACSNDQSERSRGHRRIFPKSYAKRHQETSSVGFAMAGSRFGEVPLAKRSRH
jgi:Crp-like helix-turn-helix domain